MPRESSAGVVIFRKNKEIKYLLLHYPSNSRAPKNYWDFAKGHIEKGESLIETARREAKEETSIQDLSFVAGFKEWIKYFFKFEGKLIFKIVTFYLAQTKTKKVKISDEHIGYEWLPYAQAKDRLTFKNAKEILKKAHEFHKDLNSK